MKKNNVNALKHFVFVSLLCFGVVGCVTETNQRTEQAVDLDKALELHIKLAEGYVHNSNRDSARLHLRKAFEIDKNSPQATAVMAKLYQLEGEPKLAEEYYLRALRRDKRMTDARNDYGQFLFRSKRYEDALEQFEIAAKDLDYSARARVLVNLGRTALKLGNNDRAETVFKHANILNRELAAPMLELADMNFQRQNYADAKAYLDRYLELSRPSARSLLLGIRIERTFGNKDKEASYVLALKNLHPYSREYLEYKQYMTD